MIDIQHYDRFLFFLPQKMQLIKFERVDFFKNCHSPMRNKKNEKIFI